MQQLLKIGMIRGFDTQSRFLSLLLLSFFLLLLLLFFDFDLMASLNLRWVPRNINLCDNRPIARNYKSTKMTDDIPFVQRYLQH